MFSICFYADYKGCLIHILNNGSRENYSEKYSSSENSKLGIKKGKSSL